MALLNPYLSFDARTREAMQFYAGVFGGEATFSTFADFGAAEPGSADADKVMHSQLVTPAGFTLMAADVPTSMGVELRPNGAIALSGNEVDELRGYFNRLAEGGQITLPLEQAPWGDYFGQVTDRFEVSWMVNIDGSGGASQG